VRAYEAIGARTTTWSGQLYLRALQDTNEVLLYRLLLDHIEEMTPMIYNAGGRPGVPAVQPQSNAGRAVCSSLTRCVIRSPRCCAVGPTRRWTSSSSRTASASWASATRGRRPGHPIGKLSLYTLIGGNPPGADAADRAGRGDHNNAERLNDPEYLGCGTSE